MSEGVKIERVFNLGEYKSLRAVLKDSDLTRSEKRQTFIERVADAHELFFLHQIMEADLYDKPSKKEIWEEKLESLEETRERFKQEYKLEEV
jgi:hypothetical protein